MDTKLIPPIVNILKQVVLHKRPPPTIQKNKTSGTKVSRYEYSPGRELHKPAAKRFV